MAEKDDGAVNRYGTPKRARAGRPEPRDEISKERDLNDGITRKQKYLVDELIANPLKPKSRIYKDAFDSKTTQSANVQVERHLADPRVQNYYNKEMQAQMDRVHIRQDNVLNELAALALFDVRCLFDEEGNLLPINEWPIEAGHAVASFNIREVVNSDGEVKGRDINFKLWDKPRALELLGKHMQLFIEQPTTGTAQAKEEIMERVQKLQREMEARGAFPNFMESAPVKPEHDIEGEIEPVAKNEMSEKKE